MQHTARRSRKIATAVAAVAATAIGLAGCSGGTAPAGPDTSAPVTLWINQIDGIPDWEAAIAAFTEETGIKVEFQYYQNDQFKQQIANATGTSTFPDVFINWSGVGLIGNIYQAGALQNMKDYYSQFKWEERFNEAAISAITLGGERMGVPFKVLEMAVVYKKETFEKAGITPPTTFAELEKVNADLLAKGVTPWAIAGKNSWNTMRLADSLLETSCGAEEFDKLRNLDGDWAGSKCGEAGFQTFRNWIDAGYVIPDYMALDPNANEHYDYLFDGRAAMTIDGNWTSNRLVELGQDVNDWAYFVFPTDTNRLSYFTEALYQSATAKNPEGSAKLIDFLTRADTIEKWPLLLAGALPATSGVTPAEGLSEYALGWIEINKQYTGVYGPSDQAFPPDVATAFLLANDQMQLGQLTPKQAVEAIQQAADLYEAENG